MKKIDSFSKEVRDKLGYYVYGLIDPRNGRYFYIGKGKGDRVFQHIKEVENSNVDNDKIKTIRDIQNDGLEVIHIIIRHGLNEDEAKLIEATLIDFKGLDNLTNEQDGPNNYDFGIANANQLEQKYSCEEFSDEDKPPFMIIKITQKFLDERGSYYETCRSAWKISPEKAKGKLVLCVMNGIVKKVFEVDKWQKPRYCDGRYEFIGKEADKSISDLFINKRIPEHYRQKGNANPVLYAKGGNK